MRALLLMIIIGVAFILFSLILKTQQNKNSIPTYELTLSIKMQCEDCIRDSIITDTVRVFTSNNKPYCYLDEYGNLRNGEDYIIARKVLVYTTLNVRKTQ